MNTVKLWVTRERVIAWSRVDFSDRMPGCVRGWNRLPVDVERRIAQLRCTLREHSILGEYGAAAIHDALKPEMGSGSTHGCHHQPRALATRVAGRGSAYPPPAPPKGWYLPRLAAARAELDCFDWIEDLKIANGPLFNVLTGNALAGR